MEPAKLRAENLDLFFGEKHVLRQVSICIPPRKVTALIGPSGCGKSTLLRAFNRLHDLYPEVRLRGRLYLEDIDLYASGISVTEIRRRIGMVFQKPNPLPKSIFDNLAYPLRIHKYPRRAIASQVQEALKDSFLWEEVKDELYKPAVRLSGGQQQRLCIARAIVLKPEVILMDEPCSALDPLSTQKIEDLILKLKEDYTVVIVTHNMQQARRISDYVAFMYLGELVEFNTTEKIFSEPSHELTYRYINGMFG